MDYFSDISSIDYEFSEEEEEIKIKYFDFINTGFHATKKYLTNNKEISWHNNDLFVCNQNRTAILYFIISKKEDGESPPCFIQMVTPNQAKFNDIEIKKYRGTYSPIEIEDNIAMLYNIVECDYDEIPSDMNIVGGNYKRNEIQNWNKVDVSKNIYPSQDGENYVLASQEIILPYKKGKYSVLIYPLIGLNTNYRKCKCFQKISLVFPYEAPFHVFGGIRERFDTKLFRMVSKDPLDAKNIKL